jgi:hypothetical protein
LIPWVHDALVPPVVFLANWISWGYSGTENGIVFRLTLVVLDSFLFFRTVNPTDLE